MTYKKCKTRAKLWLLLRSIFCRHINDLFQPQQPFETMENRGVGGSCIDTDRYLYFVFFEICCI